MIKVKPPHDKDEVIEDLVFALDLARMEINHPNTSDIVTLMGIINDALDLVEEVDE